MIPPIFSNFYLSYSGVIFVQTSNDIIAVNGRRGFRIVTKFIVINGLVFFCIVLFNTNILPTSSGLQFEDVLSDFKCSSEYL